MFFDQQLCWSKRGNHAKPLQPDDAKMVSVNHILHGGSKMKNIGRTVGIVTGLMFSAISFADSDCPNTSYDSGYKKQLPVVGRDELIKTSTPLFANGKITCVIGLNYRKMSENEKLRIETGSFKDIKYRIYYTDGSGSVQGDKNSTLDTIKDLHVTNWSTGCKVDGMEDKHWCYIQKKDLMVGIWKDGKSFISIGSEHFPNSNIAIRIDQQTPNSASAESGFNRKQTTQIIEQLKSGSKALTRYQEWPYEQNKDQTIDLYGFAEAWEIINTVYRTPK